LSFESPTIEPINRVIGLTLSPANAVIGAFSRASHLRSIANVGGVLIDKRQEEVSNELEACQLGPQDIDAVLALPAEERLDARQQAAQQKAMIPVLKGLQVRLKEQRANPNGVNALLWLGNVADPLLQRSAEVTSPPALQAAPTYRALPVARVSANG
jgi:hypothetical protein